MYLESGQVVSNELAMEIPQAGSTRETPSKKRRTTDSNHDDSDEDTGDDRESVRTNDHKKQNHSEIEKRRRDKMNTHIAELSLMVPMCNAMNRKLDKLTILRMVIQQVKAVRAAMQTDTDGNCKPPFPSNAQLKRLKKPAADGFLFVVSCDRGRILYVSESVSPALNYVQADLLGQSWFDIVHPKDVAKVKEQLSSSHLSPRETLIDAKTMLPFKTEMPQQGSRLGPGARRSFTCRMKCKTTTSIIKEEADTTTGCHKRKKHNSGELLASFLSDVPRSAPTLNFPFRFPFDVDSIPSTSFVPEVPTIRKPTKSTSKVPTGDPLMNIPFDEREVTLYVPSELSTTVPTMRFLPTVPSSEQQHQTVPNMRFPFDIDISKPPTRFSSKVPISKPMSFLPEGSISETVMNYPFESQLAKPSTNIPYNLLIESATNIPSELPISTPTVSFPPEAPIKPSKSFPYEVDISKPSTSFFSEVPINKKPMSFPPEEILEKLLEEIIEPAMSFPYEVDISKPSMSFLPDSSIIEPTMSFPYEVGISKPSMSFSSEVPISKPTSFLSELTNNETITDDLVKGQLTKPSMAFLSELLNESTTTIPPELPLRTPTLSLHDKVLKREPTLSSPTDVPIRESTTCFPLTCQSTMSFPSEVDICKPSTSFVSEVPISKPRFCFPQKRIRKKYRVIQCTGYLKPWPTTKMGLEDDKEADSEGEASNLSCLVAMGRVITNPLAPTPPSNPSTDLMPRQLISRHAMDGKFLHVDNRVTSMLAFLPQELLGTSMYEYYHRDDIPHLAEAHKAALQSREPVETEVYRFRCKDGTYVHFQSKWKSFVNPWTKEAEYIVAKNRLVIGENEQLVGSTGREASGEVHSSYEYERNIQNDGKTGNREISRLITSHVEATNIGRRIADEVLDERRRSVDSSPTANYSPPSPSHLAPIIEMSPSIKTLLPDSLHPNSALQGHKMTSNSPNEDSYCAVRNNVTLSSIRSDVGESQLTFSKKELRQQGDGDEMMEMIESSVSPNQAAPSDCNDEAAMAVIMSLLEADAGLGGPVDFSGLPWPLA